MARGMAVQMIRALLVGLGFALMTVGGTAGQQVGEAPYEVRVPAAPTLASALGRQHLAYEIHITNFGGTSSSLDRLEVAESDGPVVASWSGAQLRQRATLIGETVPRDPAAPLSLAPGQRAIVFAWVTLPSDRPRPSALVHRVTVSTAGDPYVFTTPPVSVVHSMLTLASPVSGGPWVAVRGPSPSSGHRLSLVALDGVVRVPQRFAVDWVRLGEDGRLFRGEGRQVSDWYGYDAPVVAVADAVVALVRDGKPDSTPRAAAPGVISAGDAPGNVVVLDLGDGRFATYAHLRTGRMAVEPGQRVHAGQILGRIGNSGNSAGPHLHFHVGDAVEPLGGEGLPFALDHFQLLGRLGGLAPMLDGERWTPREDQPSRPVAAEMPLENMVVGFDDVAR